MKYPIYNIVYEISCVEYFVATVVDEDLEKALDSLENHLKDNDPNRGKHLGLKIHETTYTNVKGDGPKVLNSHVISKRRGRLDSEI